MPTTPNKTKSSGMNEFQKLQHQKAIELQKTKCLTCAGVLSLPKEKIRDFYEAMLDRSITGPTISEVLQSWGISASPTTIHNHRSKKGYEKHMAEIKKAAGLR